MKNPILNMIRENFTSGTPQACHANIAAGKRWMHFFGSWKDALGVSRFDAASMRIYLLNEVFRDTWLFSIIHIDGYITMYIYIYIHSVCIYIVCIYISCIYIYSVCVYIYKYTVGGCEILHQLRDVVYPSILFGFQPSFWWYRISQPSTLATGMGKKHQKNFDTCHAPWFQWGHDVRSLTVTIIYMPWMPSRDCKGGQCCR